MKYLCPVCGCGELPHAPKDYMICPCCGTEFGYTDFTASHEELRDAWLASGAKWHSRRIHPPEDWSPLRQLIQAGFGAALYSLKGQAIENVETRKAIGVAASFHQGRPVVETC